jgi:hypothetical protein
VRDIEIQRRENDLVLGTFGRGFYVLDDYSPLRNLKKETFDKEAQCFPSQGCLDVYSKQTTGSARQRAPGQQLLRRRQSACRRRFYLLAEK